MDFAVNFQKGGQIQFIESLKRFTFNSTPTNQKILLKASSVAGK